MQLTIKDNKLKGKGYLRTWVANSNNQACLINSRKTVL